MPPRRRGEESGRTCAKERDSAASSIKASSSSEHHKVSRECRIEKGCRRRRYLLPLRELTRNPFSASEETGETTRRRRRGRTS